MIITMRFVIFVMIITLAGKSAHAQQQERWIVLDKESAGVAVQSITGQSLVGAPRFELISLADPTLVAPPPITDENLRVARIDATAVGELQSIMHGPRFKRCGGFTVHESRAAALAEPRNPFYDAAYLHGPIKFSTNIQKQELVGHALVSVKAENIISSIEKLMKYETRDHNTEGGKKSAEDLEKDWKKFGEGRKDYSVDHIEHEGWLQNSVVATIKGTDLDGELVVIGAHLDSINRSNIKKAPGADDDASGVAVVTEILRILTKLEDFKPRRTIKFFAYAAEEYGLLGSGEIAKTYSQAIKSGTGDIKEVVAVLQLDMAGFAGADRHMYFIDDYVSTELTDYLKKLIHVYNGPGDHEITFGNTTCGYACSDHGSWTKYGFRAAFPFESTFAKLNPKIHTPDDTVANLDTSGVHQSRFARLGLEFAIEVGYAAPSSEPSAQ